MIILGKKLITHRGESFTLGLLLSKEYNGYELPYFAQAGLSNPYYLLQVRNTEFYEKDKGSIYNYWIPCKIMKIQDDVPLKNCNLICCHGSPILCEYDDEAEKQQILSKKSPKQDDMLYGIDEYNNPYFVMSNKDKLVKIDEQYPWTMFKKTFLPIDAKRFVQGTWWYDLFLVSGTKTINYLRDYYESFFLGRSSDNPNGNMNKHQIYEYNKYGNSPKWLYDKICKFNPLFENRVRWDRPLCSYSTVDKISKPEKFIVR